MSHLFLLLLILMSGPLFGQRSDFGQAHLEAHGLVLSLKLDEARQKLDNTSSQGPFDTYTANFADILELLLNEDPSQFDSYVESEKQRLKYAENLPESPTKRFLLAEIKLHGAFVKLKFGHEWAGGWNIKQAYGFLKENQELYPNFEPNAKTAGLLNIILGSVPSQHQWILKLMGMRGSLTDGMKQLQHLSQTENTFQLESSIILLMANTYLLKAKQKSLNQTTRLLNQYPDNLLVRYLATISLSKNGRGKEALKQLNQAELIKTSELDFPFANYLFGEVFLQQGEYSRAKDRYQNFIQNFKGQGYIKDAHYKLFLTYWLSGNNEKAKEQFRYAKDRGKTISEADKHADRMLSSNAYPEKNIMKIRLATDGGYYQKALQLIESVDLQKLDSNKNKLEFTYRKARLQHQMGNLDLAKTLYLELLKNAPKENWYFLPNSTLQLAGIYEQENNHELAKQYYERTLAYKNYEYENSLNAKATAGLKRLKN